MLTQEEKQLLLKVLCAMLPYGVKVKNVIDNKVYNLSEYLYCLPAALVTNFKPCLRPRSSMTEEEKEEYWNIINLKSPEMSVGEIPSIETIAQCSIIVLDWLLSKGFDIRGLIPMGLALEAPEGMY